MRAFMLKIQICLIFALFRIWESPRQFMKRTTHQLTNTSTMELHIIYSAILSERLPVWSVENLEYSISTTLPMDDLKRLVQSLY